jgi:hypothetical protein
MEKQILWLFHS